MIVLGLLAVGLIGGVLAGLVGIGGAIFMIPALVLLFQYPQKLAQGTTLAVMLLPIGLGAVYLYHKAGNVNVKAALIIAAGFVVGAIVGALLNGHLPDTTIQRAFGVLLLVIAVKFIFF